MKPEVATPYVDPESGEGAGASVSPPWAEDTMAMARATMANRDAIGEILAISKKMGDRRWVSYVLNSFWLVDRYFVNLIGGSGGLFIQKENKTLGCGVHAERAQQ